MDVARREWIRIYISRRYSLTSTIKGVWKNRARGHESSKGTLHYRAPAWQQNGVTSPPEDVYLPTAIWWLLVTSLDEVSPVNPGTL